MCHAAQPEGIKKDVALIIVICNVILPGSGTMAAACLGTKCKGSTFWIGIAQFFTAFLIFGYFWGIIWSVFLYSKADQEAVAAEHKGVQPEEQLTSPPPVAYGATGPTTTAPPPQKQQPYHPDQQYPSRQLPYPPQGTTAPQLPTSSAPYPPQYAQQLVDGSAPPRLYPLPTEQSPQQGEPNAPPPHAD